MWVWDSDNKRMVNKEITYVPGFFKIIDEILVNAADNKVSLHHSWVDIFVDYVYADQRPQHGHDQGDGGPGAEYHLRL